MFQLSLSSKPKHLYNQSIYPPVSEKSMEKQSKGISLPYLIKSTPPLEGDGYEFELYGYTGINAGEKVSEQVYLVYANTNSASPSGFILSTLRDTGERIEFGTDENPLPIELLEQMKTQHGLAYIEADEQNGVNAFFLLRL